MSTIPTEIYHLLQSKLANIAKYGNQLPVKIGLPRSDWFDTPDPGLSSSAMNSLIMIRNRLCCHHPTRILDSLNLNSPTFVVSFDC